MRKRRAVRSMSLEKLLIQALSSSPTRAFRSVGRGAAHFGTDVGLKRDENQDRVAIARWQPRYGRGEAAFAIVVSDGMGGMQDGANCASLAVAHFIAELTSAPVGDIRQTVKRATQVANDRIFEAYRGRGGATLSAVVINGPHEVIGINVGDSRIYSPYPSSPDGLATRMTVDDTLRDAFGGESKDLLQFIGLGSGLDPHLVEIDFPDSIIAITTDGAHFIEPQIFSEVIRRAPDLKTMVERVIALSRWLGGPDNSTMGVVDIRRARESLVSDNIEGLELWTGGADGPVYILEYDRRSTDYPPVTPTRAQVAPPSPPQAASKTKRGRKSKGRPTASEQLTIDVEVSGREVDNADS